jgi:hypothetical protein
MGKDTDDAVVGFVAWIVTGILILVIGLPVTVGVAMVTNIVGGVIAFFAVTIVIVVFMTKQLSRRYKSDAP